MKTKKMQRLIFPLLIFLFNFVGIFTAMPSEAVRWFQQPSTWLTKIQANPQIPANSANYVKDVLTNSSVLAVNFRDWSVTVWRARDDTPNITVNISSSKANRSKAIQQGWNIIPIPPEAVPPGQADGHMVVLSLDLRYAWDFYQAAKHPDETWSATITRRWDLTTSGVNSPYDMLGSCRACPVPLLQGLITRDEIQSGSIDHALAFAYWGSTTRDHIGIYPCEIYVGGINPRPWAMLLGERLQLDPSVNVEALPLTPAGKVIARAMQQYGMIFVENCGPGCNAVYAESDTGKPWSWGNTFGSLSAIPLDKLRVVAPAYPKSP